MAQAMIHPQCAKVLIVGLVTRRQHLHTLQTTNGRALLVGLAIVSEHKPLCVQN